MSYEKCREILLKECELVQKVSSSQEKIRQAVMNREWTDFESSFKAINDIEMELKLLEIEREAILDKFQTSKQIGRAGVNDSRGRFYAMASLLPDNQRNDLTAIYRSLKLETLKLRMENDSFMNYLAQIKATISDFFTLAFPDRGGKIYTQKGTPFSHDMRSMVLNQSF